MRKNRLFMLGCLLIVFLLLISAYSMAENNALKFTEWGKLKVKDIDVFTSTDYTINTNRGTDHSYGWSNGYGGYGAYEIQSGIDMSKIVVSGDYTYYLLEDGTIALLDIEESHQTKKMTVPEKIDGYTVTRLGLDTNAAIHTLSTNKYIFADIVEEVVLPDTITVVASESLASNNSTLKKVTFPKGLKKLGSLLWRNSIKKLTLPKELEILGNYALTQTRYREKMLLPDTLKDIGHATFMESYYQSIVFPGGLEKIGEYVCCHMYYLTGVTLKEGVPYIGVGMFLNCPKLTKIAIPASVTYIDKYAFESCEKLSNVSFARNSSLKRIKEGAFKYSSLKSITLPDGLNEIETDAFFGSEKLTSVFIPASVTSIGNHAFDGCSDKLVITVIKDSYAEKWANDAGYKIKVKISN